MKIDSSYPAAAFSCLVIVNRGFKIFLAEHDLPTIEIEADPEILATQTAEIINKELVLRFVTVEAPGSFVRKNDLPEVRITTPVGYDLKISYWGEFA